MQRPQVDVILPTHSRPHTLGHAIASVLAQTHAELTLHVIGDGCGADSEAVVRSFADPRVRFHGFPKGKGVAYAHRNAVLRASEAPFVAYATDDDLWFPDHLERALAELVRRDVGLVAFRACHVKHPDRLDPFFFSFDWTSSPPGRFLRNWFMGSVECVHHRSVLADAGYWNERLERFGDREFYNRVRRSRRRSHYVDTVTVLRFYAQLWDRHYRGLAEPPQKRYLEAIGDPAWRARVRAAAESRGRPFGVRLEQWRDFVNFGVSGLPRYVRLLRDAPLSAKGALPC